MKNGTAPEVFRDGFWDDLPSVRPSHPGVDERPSLAALMKTYIANQISETHRIMGVMLADDILMTNVTAAADACIKSLQSGGKILLAGNGGSAADAQHIAGE